MGDKMVQQLKDVVFEQRDQLQNTQALLENLTNALTSLREVQSKLLNEQQAMSYCLIDSALVSREQLQWVSATQWGHVQCRKVLKDWKCCRTMALFAGCDATIRLNIALGIGTGFVRALGKVDAAEDLDWESPKDRTGGTQLFRQASRSVISKLRSSTSLRMSVNQSLDNQATGKTSPLRAVQEDKTSESPKMQPARDWNRRPSPATSGDDFCLDSSSDYLVQPIEGFKRQRTPMSDSPERDSDGAAMWPLGKKPPIPSRCAPSAIELEVGDRLAALYDFVKKGRVYYKAEDMGTILGFRREANGEEKVDIRWDRSTLISSYRKALWYQRFKFIGKGESVKMYRQRTERTQAEKMHRQLLLENRIYGASGGQPQRTATWEDALQLPFLAPTMCRMFGMIISCRLSQASVTHKRFLDGAIRSMASNVLPEVFVLGGALDESLGIPVTTVEKFSPTGNRWDSFPSLCIGRTYCSAVAVQGSLYVIGGYNGDKNVTNCERLRLGDTKLKWEQLPHMSAPRCESPIVATGGRIIVVDGLLDPSDWRQIVDAKKPRCEYFDLAKEEWSTLPISPSGAQATAGVIIKDRFYLACLEKMHVTQGGDILHCEYFHPMTGQKGHQQVAPLALEDSPVKEIKHAASFRHRIFLFGSQTKQVAILNARDVVWDEFDPAGQLPLRMRTIKAMSRDGSPGQLLCLGQFTANATSGEAIQSSYGLVIHFRAESGESQKNCI